MVLMGVFRAENMVVRPFWSTFSRAILGKNSAKSPLQVIFHRYIKDMLGVFQVFKCV